jgi:hypothetical protein
LGDHGYLAGTGGEIPAISAASAVPLAVGVRSRSVKESLDAPKSIGRYDEV